MALNLFSRKRATRPAASGMGRGAGYVPAGETALPDDPLKRALQQGRLGLLLHVPDDAADPRQSEAMRRRAAQQFDERFGMVPEGLASITTSVQDQPGAPEVDHEIEAFLLARHAVTNEDYQFFVDDGGYDQLELWPEDIWPHLVGFKDHSGAAGPRFWRKGRHDKRLARHPVVGVNYYEAAAYSEWAGLCLPTSPQWQMAASWRVRSEAAADRRYPWGDALDLERCNIWAAGHARTLPVNACPSGAAPNGVLQLIGNVWEWTRSDFDCVDDQGRRVIGEMPMKCIRGGAFDTYFPWQAVSAFQSGLTLLTRAHNVGFRCASNIVDEC